MSDLFTGEGFAPEVLADCARREVAKRRSVYPRLVADGKLTQRKADREIELMQAIADHFTEAAKAPVSEQTREETPVTKGSST